MIHVKSRSRSFKGNKKMIEANESGGSFIIGPAIHVFYAL